MNELDKFNERIGYEKFLLQESLDIMSVNKGIEVRFSIVFLNHNYETHVHELGDCSWTPHISSFIEQHLLPLIFTSSYKIIDMFIEFILDFNNYQVPWQFTQKIKMVQKLINNLSLPNVITIKEFQVIFMLYNSLVKNRNSIIHGSWGCVNNGALEFTDGTKITKGKVMAFANVSYLITEILNMDKNDQFYNSTKYTLYKNLNLISDLNNYQFTSFPENIVLYYEVKYKISNKDEEVDMLKVKKYINDDLSFWRKNDNIHKFEAVYNLYVITEKGKWKIPSNAIKKSAVSINLNDYKKYICK